MPIDITKLINLYGIKRTSKQERATKRYKQTYVKGLQKNYGPEITNPSQIAEVKKKRKETYAKTYGSYQNYLNWKNSRLTIGTKNYQGSSKQKEAMEKIKNTCLERYGNENFGLGTEAKEKARVTRKNVIANWSYEERLERTRKAREALLNQGFVSNPEKRIRKSLIDLNVEAKHNVFLWNYNWDLVIDNILIEVQGIFWHAKPSIYKPNDLILGEVTAKDLWDKDNRKKKKALENGYKVIEVWEDEITKKTDAELLKLVRQRLLENEYVF